MKRALVFSGGGAKGAYEVGVWKALRILGQKFDIVTGTSIGSVNAAMYVQKKYFLTKRMWLNTKTEDILEMDVEAESKNNMLKTATKFAEIFLAQGGLDFSKAEKVLRKVIDEDKIRRSNIDYGLVTFSYKNKQPKVLAKKDIPDGKLVDYIVASCTCFPAIKMKDIDDDTFIDGGFYDNVPINLAIDMGAEEIVAVDLNALGIRQKVKNNNVKIDIIKSHDTGALLTFNKEVSRKRINLGYNDTMKYYDKLDGEYFTFKKGELERNYNNLEKYYINLIKNILLSQSKKKIITEIFNIANYNKLFLKIKNNESINNEINNSLEYLGKIFNLEEDKIYNIDKFNKIILRNVKELEYLKIDKNLKGKMLIGYIYNKYINTTDKQILNKELFNIALIFPKEFLAAIYLISISKKHELMLKADLFYQEILDALKRD